MNNIGIENIISIGEEIIEHDKLLCDICFCIVSDPVECQNKKCRKKFCSSCIQTANNQTLHKICPFCRSSNQISFVDDEIHKILDKAKLYCPFSSCKSSIYLKDVKSHFKKDHQIINCNSCEKSISKEIFIKCSICNRNYCDKDKCQVKMITCFYCRLKICKACYIKPKSYNSNIIDSEYDFIKGKLLNEEILCQNCSVICTTCKNKEASIACQICLKIICNENCAKTLQIGSYSINICKDEALCFSSLKCNDCNKKTFKITKILDKIKILLNCKICRIKCNGQSCYLQFSNTCYICKNKTCIKCCSIKCSSCKNSICNCCNDKCLVCKEISCSKCTFKCDNCKDMNICYKCYYKENGISIKKCENCDIKLCFNCWNVCNTCKLIYCKKDINKCADCDEFSCTKHTFNCSECNVKTKSTIKVCIKNCSNKCSFCDNISSNFCIKDRNDSKNVDNKIKTSEIINNSKISKLDNLLINSKSNHTFVQKLACNHNVCKKCIKYCGKCPKSKRLISCPQCVVSYYYFYCIYCQEYLCNNCSKFCKKCEEPYCTGCICRYCGIVSNKCNKCNLSNSCKGCNVKFNPCNACKKTFICSENCYINYKKRCVNNKEHICNNFYCDTCSFKLPKEKQILNTKFLTPIKTESKFQDKKNYFNLSEKENIINKNNNNNSNFINKATKKDNNLNPSSFSYNKNKKSNCIVF